ncbi:hypothetical protein E2562_008893 [Oryza meyeriana var. granulata]|uniref:Uncharacterized protein n=1 Tax=Oryza meyeriana var. granulata TaxID=110450 RepID=A0A6G1CZH2_9ORYZ|nr:hypothetical protein E2562_008893 [Oryza meyeriana var. granulata]
MVAAVEADPAAPSLKVRIRLRPTCVATAEDDGRVAERRVGKQEERLPMEPLSTGTKRRREGEEGSGASKKKQASEPAASVPGTRISPAAPASCVKNDTLVRAHAAVRDDGPTPRAIKNCTTGERRQEKDAKDAQESARMRNPRVPSTRTTKPAAPAPSCVKKETPVRAHAAVRDDDMTPRTIKKCRTSQCERRQEKDGQSARQCTRMSSPRVQPSPAARPDPNAAQNSLRAAIDRARPALHMRRDVWRQSEAARRELAKVVRTVEFNDPFISPQDVLKP